MEIEKSKAIIEAILFAAGRIVKSSELILVLEKNEEEIHTIIKSMQEEYKANNRGIEIIQVEDGYQLATKKELYEYIYPILDKRTKPNLSTAALETLAIIAYNPRITRAEIEAIRGVSADACVYKLLEFGLVEEAGKTDLPGKPMSYKTTDEFLKMFGYTSLKDLPELPRYKLDSNQQIVIDDLIDYLNSKDKRVIYELIKKYHKQFKKTILVCSNNADGLIYFKKILVLDKGIIKFDGTIKKINELEKVFDDLGINMPFIVDLSIKLKLYNLVDKIYIDDVKLVNDIWKEKKK